MRIIGRQRVAWVIMFSTAVMTFRLKGGLFRSYAWPYQNQTQTPRGGRNNSEKTHAFRIFSVRITRLSTRSATDISLACHIKLGKKHLAPKALVVPLACGSPQHPKVMAAGGNYYERISRCRVGWLYMDCLRLWTGNFPIYMFWTVFS